MVFIKITTCIIRKSRYIIEQWMQREQQRREPCERKNPIKNDLNTKQYAKRDDDVVKYYREPAFGRKGVLNGRIKVNNRGRIREEYPKRVNYGAQASQKGITKTNDMTLQST